MSNVFRIDPGNALSFSAFESKAREFEGASVLAGDRYADMCRRASFYECTQHDHKRWDFDGRPTSSLSPRSMQPLIGQQKSWWVPLSMRRPLMTHRLGKIIVDSFTNLLFGEQRFPQIRVEGDEQTEDFLQAVAKAGKLPLKMIEARNIGGSCGTVGLSWCFHEGRPRFEVHHGKDLFVHAWRDRLELIPDHVTEAYLFAKTKWDGKGFDKQLYWFRRDWTPEADIVFKDLPFDPSPDVVLKWEVDLQKSNFHGDGVIHLEWIQNLPSNDVDGVPDYHGLYDEFDVIDTLASVVSKGAILNLDPTLLVKMDRMEMDYHGLRKGSENAVVVGKEGDASYLELGGQSIDAGVKLLEFMRRSVFETAQCIVPDPHEVAAQGVSSVAMKMMYSPMTSKTDVLREQYGAPVERMLGNMAKVAREKLDADVTVVDEDGNKTKAKFVINLPQKIEKTPLTDPVTDEETDDERTTKTDRAPGESQDVTLTWPPYFPPTPQDQGQIATFLQTSTGGKPVLSQQSAVEAAALAVGKDPAVEWKRVQAMAKDDEDKQAAMGGGDIGGQVSHPNQLPAGAAPRPPHPMPPGGGAPDPNDPDADIPVDVDLTGGAPPPKKPPFGG